MTLKKIDISIDGISVLTSEFEKLGMFILADFLNVLRDIIRRLEKEDGTLEMVAR